MDTLPAKPMERVLYEVKKVIVGQDHLLERLLVALLARGHILVEGVPGLAKTMAIQDAGRGHWRPVSAHPVYARSRPRRPDRHAHLQPKNGRLQHLARPGLHQPAAGRRDQSRARQSAERPAGGDAGAAGHHRARDAQSAQPLSRAGDAEPHRIRGDLSAARSAGGSLYAQGAGGLPHGDRGICDRGAHDGARCRPWRRCSTRRSC